MSLFSKKKKKIIPQKSWQRRGLIAESSVAKRDEKRKERKFSRFLFWFLLLVFVGICVYLLLFSPFLEIEKININGNQDIPSIDIQNSAEKSLAGNYLGFLPRKNYFLINKNSIKGAIKDNLSRLEVGSIDKIFPNIIDIQVVERKAEIVWCSAGVCYFADDDGLVYGGTSASEDDLRSGNFLVVVDESARPVAIGETRINSDYIEYIEAINKMLQNDLQIGIIESYHTPGIASQELSVRTSEGWILKISSEYSVDEAKKIIQTLFDKELNEETRKKLDYLDLRIKNKIYYKLKSEEENSGTQ